MPSTDQVYGQLRIVGDPDFGLSLVELGLIYEVRCEGCWGYVRLATSPGSVLHMPATRTCISASREPVSCAGFGRSSRRVSPASM
jgi:metal-sulfur cluster biosynthetic enzyme